MNLGTCYCAVLEIRVTFPDERLAVKQESREQEAGDFFFLSAETLFCLTAFPFKVLCCSLS